MNRLVIFSHGFGVKQDDRGLFTEIAAELGLKNAVMFDYGIIDDASNTITFPPLVKQAEQLSRVINEHVHDDQEFDLICHSQGCVVAGIAGEASARAKHVIMLAPPLKLGSQRQLSYFRQRPGTVIDPRGEARFARADGGVTIVEPEYLNGLDELDPVLLFNHLAEATAVTAIWGKNDEVLKKFEMEDGKLSSKVKQLSLPADHNFTGSARQLLIDLLRQELRA